MWSRPKRGKVFYNNAVNFSLLDVLEHFLKGWTVKSLTAETIINIETGDYDLILLSPFFDNEFLIFHRPMRISVENRQPDIADSIFVDWDS